MCLTHFILSSEGHMHVVRDLLISGADWRLRFVCLSSVLSFLALVLSSPSLACCCRGSAASLASKEEGEACSVGERTSCVRGGSACAHPITLPRRSHAVSHVCALVACVCVHVRACVGLWKRAPERSTGGRRRQAHRKRDTTTSTATCAKWLQGESRSTACAARRFSTSCAQFRPNTLVPCPAAGTGLGLRAVS